MKRIILTIAAILTIAVSANAMSYEQARNEALFLTDKMAYELNLSDAQYDAAYEINLDYLMGVTGRDNVYGTYWTRRNLDISYILLDWQWKAFQAATYFYRPLYWSAGFWHFGIYARYPHRNYFYFGRPTVYVSYRGGHSWRHHGGKGYYYGKRHQLRPKKNGHFGMRDKWNRGDFKGSHNSSTHVTVNNKNGNTPGNNGGFGGNRKNGHFGNNRNDKGTEHKGGSGTIRPKRTENNGFKLERINSGNDVMQKKEDVRTVDKRSESISRKHFEPNSIRNDRQPSVNKSTSQPSNRGFGGSRNNMERKPSTQSRGNKSFGSPSNRGNGSSFSAPKGNSGNRSFGSPGKNSRGFGGSRNNTSSFRAQKT
ncbi:hypothetical protein [Xylanibacter muris]|uniref:hypothetical protein n=1 Tax=Xylanibacter muris TaxID=2736290 RepID=UPI001C131E35|nr:hypothetical protein [Xylanibacter muris]